MTLGPKGPQERKRRLFRGARERIVRTDIELQSESRQRRAAESERDLFKSVLEGPLEQTYLESLHRQIGAMLADQTFSEIEKEIPLGSISPQMLNRMRELAEQAGDYVSADIIEHYFDRGSIDVRIDARPMDEAAVVTTSIDLPSVQLRYHNVHRRF